jgi:hypothetical protein
LQLVVAERFHVGYLVGELKPGMALAVIEHRAEVLRRGLGVKRSPLENVTSVAQGEDQVLPSAEWVQLFASQGFTVPSA